MVQRIRPLTEHSSPGYTVNVDEGSIILLFCITSVEEYHVLKRLAKDFRSKSGNLNFVVFATKPELITENEDTTFSVYSIDDFSYLGIPKAALKKWLGNNKFDILLSFADSECVFCNKLINLINADFKVGKYNERKIRQYDLTIAFDTSDYFKQFDHYIYYLKNLNINI